MSEDPKIHDLSSQKRTLEQLAEIQRFESSLRHGGGGPYDPGMERRVASLEDRMDRVERKLDTLNDKVGDLSTKIGELIGKVGMLPGYPGIGVMMGLVGGALLIVSRLFPAGPPTP